MSVLSSDGKLTVSFEAGLGGDKSRSFVRSIGRCGLENPSISASISALALTPERAPPRTTTGGGGGFASRIPCAGVALGGGGGGGGFLGLIFEGGGGGGPRPA